jgi:TonB family protein
MPAAFAGSKESPHDTLAKSFQQAGIWNQGPVKLVAKMSVPKPDGTSVTLELTYSWAGPNKWRSEWTANGFEQVTVLNNGKLSYFSTLAKPIVRVVAFEAAIAMLDGANPAGPYSVPPVDWDKAKLDTSKKKVGNVDAKCMAFGEPTKTFCVDEANGHLLSYDSEYTTFEYSDYATTGSNAYPQALKVIYAKTPWEDGKLTVTRGEKFDDALFAPPDKSTTIDFPACGDVDKNYAAPQLSKTVKPKMPDAAKKAKKFGLVLVLASVGKDGSVQKATVLAADYPELNQAAADAVQQYKFTPYLRCGQAVEFQKLVVVPFAPPAPIPNL